MSKVYSKISNSTVYSENHFYKMIRYVFFGRLIFTVDVYPSEMSFGIMWAYSSWHKTILRLT